MVEVIFHYDCGPQGVEVFLIVWWPSFRLEFIVEDFMEKVGKLVWFPDQVFYSPFKSFENEDWDLLLS